MTATTTAIEKQMILSDLEITRTSSSLSSSLLPLQWNSTNPWSPLLVGPRKYQACVVVNGNNSASFDDDDDVAGQSVVVLGGEMIRNERVEVSNSVIVWDPSTQQWRYGPFLIEERACFTAVVCQDSVYAIGGYNRERQALDTIEIIEVSSLLGVEAEISIARQGYHQWTRLPCRLPSPRCDFAAVVVHNRYIVIIGGYDNNRKVLSSVEILDTTPDNNNGEPTIVAGPNMNSTRFSFAAAVVDNRIFVIGGFVAGRPSASASVESISFSFQQQQERDKDNSATSSNSYSTSTYPTFSSWRVERHLTLSTARCGHAVAKVGSCLIVAGGERRMVVEVLDVQWGVMWKLPNLTIFRPAGCSMVALSDCLLAVGGTNSDDRAESLPLTISRKHKRCYKLVSFLIENNLLNRQGQ